MSVFRSPDDYTIGWICALPLELAAAQHVLDNIHPDQSQLPQDRNAYVLGDVNGHNVVVACLPSGVYGTISAAVVASQMLSTYRKIRFGLLVGIGGGVPNPSADIRLGDIVVSKPTGDLPGVVQYDFGKTLDSGRIQRTGSLNQPALALLTALARLEGRHWVTRPKFHDTLSHTLSKISGEDIGWKFQYPGREQDILFQADYSHPNLETECLSCDNFRVVHRRERISTAPRVHYGLIASGNQVMKDACTRDKLAKDLGVLCFEMEAAGLMNHFPCLVIRGICDYADSHKNKQWQGYSAMAAAAYSKELLSAIPLTHEESMVPSQREISTSVCGNHSVGFASMYKPSMPFFIGREQELEEIHTKLQTLLSGNTVVLYGLGGIGKTQLALAYAMQYLTAYTAVFWFDATNELSLASDFLKMAERILVDHPHLVALERIKENRDAASAMKWANKWLSSRGNDHWLLIYDNYEPVPGFALESWQPNVPRGHTIITTRKPDPGLGESILVSRIQKLEHNREILLRQPGPPDPTRNLSLDPELDKLVIKLDGLPFGLAGAGRFLKKTTMSCAEYLRELNYRQLPGDEGSNQSYALEGNERLEMTWSIARDQMCEEPNFSKFLLTTWAGLDSQDMWYELLESVNHTLWQGFQIMNRAQFHDSMKTICDYGFAEFGSVPDEHAHGSRGYTLHRCVHRWLIRTALAEDLETMVYTGLIIVNSHSEQSSGFQKIEVNRRLLAHANHLLHISSGEFAQVRFRYELALQLTALSTIFRTNTMWLSSPLVTFWLNIFQVNHPNLDKELKCLRIVVSLCKDTEDQSSKNLHQDALNRLASVHFSREIFYNVKNRWLENNACRASYHPTEYVCSRCLRNLHTDILPIPLFLILLLWMIIVSTWSTLMLPLENLISAISSQLSYVLICSAIPRWKYRRTAFMLGILLVIEDIFYNWYVLETNLMVFVFASRFLVIFGNLPVLCLTEGISLVQLSGFSSHLESESLRLRSGNSSREPGNSRREPGNSRREPGNSRREPGNSRREQALLRMGEGFSENSVMVYWVAIGILFFLDLCCTLPVIFGP